MPRHCIIEGCGKQANFGKEGTKTATHCGSCNNEHKLGLVDVKSKKCKTCGKQAYFGKEGSKTATHCGSCNAKHELGLVDVKNKKCDICNYIQGHKRKDKKVFCARCYANTYPEEKSSRRYLSKEKFVRQAIQETFPDITWICDRRIEGGCSGRRPDNLAYFGNFNLLIEVDEDEHKDRTTTCEVSKINDTFYDLGETQGGYLPFHLIRFNPDKYIDSDGKKHISCFTYTKDTGSIKTTREWEVRWSVLKATIDKIIKETKVEKITKYMDRYMKIHYLFYTEENPNIIGEEESIESESGFEEDEEIFEKDD